MEPQLDPTIAPAPASPPQVGSEPAPEQGAMSQEQMRANLEALMNKIEEKFGQVKSLRSTNSETIMEQKSIALREVFDLLQSMGIDPNNVDEIRQFLDGIKQSDPELSQHIERALADLLKDEGVEPVAAEEPLPEEGMQPNMNIPNNEAIQ